MIDSHATTHIFPGSAQRRLAIQPAVEGCGMYLYLSFASFTSYLLIEAVGPVI